MLAKNALQSTTSTISSTMATQKALVLPEKYGGFVVDSAVPIRKFGLDLVQSYPVILGFDIAGEVVAVGEGVGRFKVGAECSMEESMTASFILGGFEEYPDTRIDPRQSDI
ncbi:hypothetical protein FA13DRAFT_686582 [Coprinellus micaceus]|uniref:Alcohol dehydrogenase-like N-terminal domain-containing protein n=1 Tax=Coprinellus micaceus TaxID=71717 RepID=A0A4Y7T4E6_COPMI|nr:hypothetical protein FA13DRAFT_686582 [Coprinellus micaceus]